MKSYPRERASYPRVKVLYSRVKVKYTWILGCHDQIKIFMTLFSFSFSQNFPSRFTRKNKKNLPVYFR
jgi:hypothetical protein